MNNLSTQSKNTMLDPNTSQLDMSNGMTIRMTNKMTNKMA